MQAIMEWLTGLEWSRLLPELIGKGLGFLAGFAASWFLLFRKRLNALQRLKRGDSDDVIFQMHKLWPVPDQPGQFVLLFRNIAPKTTLDSLYDNPAALDAMQQLAERTSLSDPILQTDGTLGFEMLNDAAGHIAGLMAPTAFPRRVWLFVLTCEDRAVVRRKCIRAFLIQPEDLQPFADWKWCCKNVLVESPWHWFRIVALHRIACYWVRQQQQSRLRQDGDMPLVDQQLDHERVRPMSLGINQDEQPVRAPHRIEWSSHLASLRELGLELEADESSPHSVPATASEENAG